MQLCNRCRSFHLAPLIGNGNAIQGKRKGLAHKVDAATIEAGRFGLTTATWYFEWHAWKLTRPKPTRLKVCQGTTRPASQTNRPSRLYRPIHRLGAALVSVTIPCAANLGCARFSRGVPPTGIDGAKAPTIYSAPIRVASRRSCRTTMRGMARLIAGSALSG